MILLPLHLVYAPPPPPAPPSGNVLPLTNALTHSLDSIRKIYLQKILQKLRKCKNQVPIKVPFSPHICPPPWSPWSPYPRSNFFVSKQSLDIYLESILMNYLPRMLQMLKKIRYFYSLFSENLRLAQNLPNEVFLTISDFKVDIPYKHTLRITLEKFPQKNHKQKEKNMKN